MYQRKFDSFYCGYGNFHWVLWKINSAHHSLALFQTRLAACGWLNHFSCLHDWQTNVAIQSAPPRPHGIWCTCKPLPKIRVANLVFSSVSPACFKMSSTDEELQLWIGARHSFMWLLSVIYERQQKHRDTKGGMEERGRSLGWLLWGWGWRKFPMFEVSYRSLRQQVLKLLIQECSCARVVHTTDGCNDTTSLPPVASQVCSSLAVFSFLSISSVVLRSITHT